MNTKDKREFFLLGDHANGFQEMNFLSHLTPPQVHHEPWAAEDADATFQWIIQFGESTADWEQYDMTLDLDEDQLLRAYYEMLQIFHGDGGSRDDIDKAVRFSPVNRFRYLGGYPNHQPPFSELFYTHRSVTDALMGTPIGEDFLGFIQHFGWSKFHSGARITPIRVFLNTKAENAASLVENIVDVLTENGIRAQDHRTKYGQQPLDRPGDVVPREGREFGIKVDEHVDPINLELRIDRVYPHAAF